MRIRPTTFINDKKGKALKKGRTLVEKKNW